jgi:hypothetical protein
MAGCPTPLAGMLLDRLKLAQEQIKFCKWK